jgi:hypothetical protein
LAEMIGTTRSRVSFFMNKFRKLGFIEYNGGLSVHSSLLNVVLHDWRAKRPYRRIVLPPAGTGLLKVSNFDQTRSRRLVNIKRLGEVSPRN